MKINEVEAAVGVTKKNIRFYEEEGLISPRREPGNGYRSYSEADVERLRRIKLLRKLDVPLAEIRQMLEGECTLAEGMTRQLERLNTRRTDLDEAVNFCTLLQKEPVSLNELDVEQTLARLTAKEEQGVSFVNIEQTDRKAERVRGALVGAGLFTAIMLLSIGIMAWSFCVDPQDVPPLPLLVDGQCSFYDFLAHFGLEDVYSSAEYNTDRKSTRLNSSHDRQSRMPSSA